MEHKIQTTTTDHALTGADSAVNEKFTMFGLGYINSKGVAVLAARPKMTVDIPYVYRYIREGWAEQQTSELVRLLPSTDNDEQQTFKKLNFETVTFAGRFRYRNRGGLIERTPFMVLDLDHLGNTERARVVQQTLINDPEIETVLSFLSPRQEGIKWVIRIPHRLSGMTYREQAEAMGRYVGYWHGLEVDVAKEENRTCYLPSDPECYINPKYLQR